MLGPPKFDEWMSLQKWDGSWLTCIYLRLQIWCHVFFGVSMLNFGRVCFFFLHVGVDVKFLLSFLLSLSRLCDHSLGSDRGGGERKTQMECWLQFEVEMVERVGRSSF